MKTTQQTRKTDALAVLILFTVFSACILSVLLTGAGVYRRLAQRDTDSFQQRTAAQYLTTRLRQADRLGGVAVTRFHGLDALVLTEQIQGSEYETLIYCQDGYLWELFGAAGGDFAPQDGEKVLQAQQLLLRLDGRMLTALLTGPSGQSQQLRLLLRSQQEVAP